MNKLERTGQMMIYSDTGGYFINIDPAGNLIHKDSCSEKRRMDPEKEEGAIFHCEDYDEAISYLNNKNIKFRSCEKCSPP